MRSLRYFSFTAAILFIAAFSSFAQIGKPEFTRAQTFDVRHYSIRASFDRTNKKVIGDTTVTLSPLKTDLRIVELDAVDIAFASVTLDGKPAQYKTIDGKVIVTLDKAYGPADVIALQFKYTASPKKGVYFVDAESGRGAHSAQIWTQGEAEEARYWIPSYDFPSDKATTEQYLTVEKDETVIGNGELIGKEPNTDGTVTWHYKMPVPHSTYLISFVIGKYVRVDDKHGDIPLGFYVYPGKEETAKKAFGDTAKMMAVFEELTGVKFPYNKYDQTIVAKFQFGGMENITATTMSDNEIFFADFDFGKAIVTDLVSHELAHSWFGDLVTCRNWAELWLNEGFATYMEAAYREKVNGREDYITKVRSDAGDFLVDDSINRKRHGLYNRRAEDVNGLFDNAAITYNKGGAVLHMLREQVGTENFWKAVNIYLNRHKLANVESTDLKRAMEETSGQDLGWFFDQWVYGISAPKLTVKPVYSSRTKTLKLTITQTQKPEALVTSAFRMPMDIEIKAARTTSTKPVTLTKRVEVISIPSATKPSEIVLDPTDKVILKTVKMLPITVVR
ncbi:MAG TPA: M1 family metallopeptidase [Pyrinomonadaceae bacterium]|nr:M1 family metallopeptidase [Pyrinomonadaceae bacterium]